MIHSESMLSGAFKRDLMGVMVGQVRCPDEVVFRGQPKFWYEHMEESFLFFLMKGRLMAFIMEEGAAVSGEESIRIESGRTLPGEVSREELEAGSTFGERDCLFNKRDPDLLVTTLDFSDVYTVRKDVFNTVCRHYLEEVSRLPFL